MLKKLRAISCIFFALKCRFSLLMAPLAKEIHIHFNETFCLERTANRIRI